MNNNYDGGYYWDPNNNINYRANTISEIWNTYLNNAATYGATVSSFNIFMGYWASSQYDVSDAFYMHDEYKGSYVFATEFKNEIDVYRNKIVEPINIMSVTPSSLFVEYTRIPNKIIKIVYTNHFNIALTDIFIPYL